MTQEERWRAILPLLRPRSAELTPELIAGLVVIGAAIAALIFLYFFRRHQFRQEEQRQFFLQGLEKGLEEDQVAFLWRLTQRHRVKNPHLILTSVYTFDRQVQRYLESLSQPGEQELEFITRLRAALGFDQLKPDQPLRTTHQLQPGQHLLVWSGEHLPPEGAPWIVLSRSEQTLTAVPMFREGERLDLPGLEAGSALAARFWREGDTEYRFETQVLEVDESGVVFRHTQVERLQQRDFFRLDCRFPISLLLLPPDPEPEPPPVDLPCFSGEVLNISAGGLGLLLPQPLPEAGQFLVPAQFQGPFPLANVRCQLIRQFQQAEWTSAQLQFVGLPPAVENEIVRRIYQQQILGPVSVSPVPPGAPEDVRPPLPSSS